MRIPELDFTMSLVGRCKEVEDEIDVVEVYCPEFKYFLSKRIYLPVLQAAVFVGEYIHLMAQVEDAFADKDLGEDNHFYLAELDDNEKRYLQTLLDENICACFLGKPCVVNSATGHTSGK